MMTFLQYKSLSPAKLVMRLARRHLFSLALAFASSLSIRFDDILNCWAIHKARSMHLAMTSDDGILNTLTANLKEHATSSSFMKAVLYIYTTLQRKQLALRLLPLICGEHDQVHLLIHMKQLRMALTSSISSQNIDLLTEVIIRMDKENPSFLNSLKTGTEYVEIEPVMMLLNLNLNMHERRVRFLSSCSCFSPGTFGRLSLAMVNRITVALVRTYIHLLSSCGAEQRAAFSLSLLQNVTSKASKGALLVKQATEDHDGLLDAQLHLENVSNIQFQGLTLTQTLYKCLWEMTNFPVASYIDWIGEINKLMKEFKVAESVLWHLKLQCYSRCNRYDLIRNLSIQKPSPIGYKPFAAVCIE